MFNKARGPPHPQTIPDARNTFRRGKERRSIDEQQKTIERLAGRTGYGAEEVRILLERQGLTEEAILLTAQDEDLWLVHPELHWVSTDPKEEVEVWRHAVGKLEDLATATSGGALFDNIGVAVCLGDAADRAREVLRRARQRARVAS